MSLLLALVPLGIFALALLALPPLGALLSGQPLGQFLVLPLAERAWDPLPPDPAAFSALSAAAILGIGAALWLARPRRPLPQRGRESTTLPDLATHSKRPLRSIVFGILALGAAWTLALADLAGLSQPVLILGLTLTLAGHTEWRLGSSAMTQRPAFFALAFPVSALVGWLFHWLNLFLQLWTYPQSAAEPGAAIPFVLVRTLDYATLLPALLVFRQWLASWHPLLNWCSRAAERDAGRPGLGGWFLPVLAVLGLGGTAPWSDWIWPLSWIAPLLLILGMQRLGSAGPGLLAGIARGDWSRLLIPALAALLLGLIIQGWNSLVGPVWIFHLPLVQTQTLFGLPLPAYAGLLPLGPLGIWIADQLAHPWRRRPMGRERPFPIRISINP